jgi:Bacterial Ig domain
MKTLLLILLFAMNIFFGYSQDFHLSDGMQSCQAKNIDGEDFHSQNSLKNNVNSSLPRVRIAYVVPSNRTAQADYKENLQFAIEMAQKWYRDNMEQNGFGAKTFIFETEENSPRPKIHLVNVPETDSYLRGSGADQLYDRTRTAVQNMGLSIGTGGEIWVLIPETLLQNPDASFIGGLTLGSGTGNGRDSGLTELSSSVIELFNPQTILNNTPYNGQIVPAWGPYPLRQNISFASFEGETFSSIASSYLGALCHEIGHSFGLNHDSRHDNNFFGGLMYNGLRGIRGSFFPSLYPTNYTRLEYSSSLQLNQSHYFNRNKIVNTPPSLIFYTSGDVTPMNGLLTIDFAYSGSVNLAYAQLINQNGDVIDEIILDRISATTQFKTPYYTSGQSNNYKIALGDSQGNRSISSSLVLNVAGVVNQAPVPSLRIFYPNAPYTINTLFNSAYTTDANNDAFMTEFDFNNDGIFDTSPSSNPEVSYNIPQQGPYMSRIRVTDIQGASYTSTPISGNYGKQCGIEAPTIYGNSKICAGSSVILTANNCYGTYLWSNGETSKSITVSPIISTNYTINCQYGCSNQTSQAFLVEIIPDNLVLVNSATTVTQKAAQTITSTQTILNNNQVTYISGNSITLLPNFTTENGSRFLTVLQACNLPVATADNVTALIEVPKSIQVLLNDYNFDGTDITELTKISLPNIITNPSKGIVLVNSDGTIIYTANADVSGTDTFVYSICNQNNPTQCANATVTVTLQETINPIQNPNFETAVDFLNTPWQKGGWKPNQAVFSWLSGQGRNNSNCIKIYTGPSTGSVQSNDIHVFQKLTLNSNTDYTFKAWVKTVNVSQIANPNGKGACLSLIVDGNPWPPASIGLNGTNDWTQLSLNFNSGISGIITIACRLGYTNADSEGTAYFDDLKILPR